MPTETPQVNYFPGQGCTADIPTEPAPVDPNGAPIMVVGHLGEGIAVPGEPLNKESAPIPTRYQNGDGGCSYG